MSEVAQIDEKKLSTQLEQRQIKPGQWHTLAKSLYPGASIDSVLMVIDYCKARGLDPLKKPCHIVPMEVKVGNGYAWRDVVMPGIYEYRTTAQKTREYLGHSTPVYGDEVDYKGVMAPESCSLTVYRWNEAANMRAEYPVTVWFSEVVALKRNKQTKEMEVNSRWSKAPRQMLTKCAEAAALREAFPDELGGEMTFEEMVDQRAPEIDPHDPPFYMSKQAVTKVVGPMNAAIANDDHGGIWEIYSAYQETEEGQREWAYITDQLDRWRAKEWEKAILAAGRTFQSEEVEPDISGAGS